MSYYVKETWTYVIINIINEKRKKTFIEMIMYPTILSLSLSFNLLTDNKN